MKERAAELAAALLLREGAISVSDIAALPDVEDESDALAIASGLMQRFDTYRARQEVNLADNLAVWEDVMILRNHPHGSAGQRARERRATRVARSQGRSGRTLA